MPNFLKIREHDAHLEWRIERPERMNGLGTSLARELNEALAELKRGGHVPRALVLTATPVGKGTRRTWIAGGDLKELQELKTGADAGRYAASLSAFVAGLEELPCPVITAVDGAAIGGGAELALAGDLRLATSGSTFEFKQLRVGLATGYGGAKRLCELIGLGRAQGLLYRSESLSADGAFQCGLIHEVVPDEAALGAKVQELARNLAALSPAALAAQKAMLHAAVRGHPGAARGTEAELFARIWRNPEHQRFLAEFNKGGQ